MTTRKLFEIALAVCVGIQTSFYGDSGEGQMLRWEHGRSIELQPG